MTNDETNSIYIYIHESKHPAVIMSMSRTATIAYLIRTENQRARKVSTGEIGQPVLPDNPKTDREALHPIISGPSDVNRLMAKWLKQDSNTRKTWVRILTGK